MSDAEICGVKMFLLSEPMSLDIIGNELNNHLYDFKRRVTKWPIKTNLGYKDYNGGIYLSEPGFCCLNAAAYKSSKSVSIRSLIV